MIKNRNGNNRYGFFKSAVDYFDRPTVAEIII